MYWEILKTVFLVEEKLNMHTTLHEIMHHKCQVYVGEEIVLEIFLKYSDLPLGEMEAKIEEEIRAAYLKSSQ